MQFVQKEQPQTVEADAVLIAVGRSANTSGLLAEGFSLPMERGKFLVNEHYQMACLSIYVIGGRSAPIPPLAKASVKQ